MFAGVALALHLFKAHVLILTSAYKIKTLALKRLILKRHIAKKKQQQRQLRLEITQYPVG